MKDNKELVLAILGKGKPKAEDEYESDEGAMPSKSEIARELIDAVKAEDEQGVADAIQALVDLCESDEDSEDDGE